MLSVPVATLDPLGSFAGRLPQSARDAASPFPGIALACGLALRGLRAYA